MMSMPLTFHFTTIDNTSVFSDIDCLNTWEIKTHIQLKSHKEHWSILDVFSEANPRWKTKRWNAIGAIEGNVQERQSTTIRNCL